MVIKSKAPPLSYGAIREFSQGDGVITRKEALQLTQKAQQNIIKAKDPGKAFGMYSKDLTKLEAAYARTGTLRPGARDVFELFKTDDGPGAIGRAQERQAKVASNALAAWFEGKSSAMLPQPLNAVSGSEIRVSDGIAHSYTVDVPFNFERLGKKYSASELRRSLQQLINTEPELRHLKDLKTVQLNPFIWGEC
jgi:hypothetical protein